MDSLSVHTCIASASSFAIPVGITKGGVVLARARAFSCLFMQLMITCCLRVHSVPFIALAICKAFWNSTVFTLHAWCHRRCPALVLPRGWGHFLMMDAGGSPFPHTHNEGASMDGGITIVAGTTGSGTACTTDPTGGSTVWGPSSMGSVLGNSGSPPGVISRALVSWRRRFLELL